MKRRNKIEEDIELEDDVIETPLGIDLSDLADEKYASIFEKRSKAHTLLKHAYIYNEYLKVNREMERTFPEIALFLPRKYYYIVIAHRFRLTPNYVCALINAVRRRGDTLKKDVEKAKKITANDDYREYFRR